MILYFADYDRDHDNNCNGDHDNDALKSVLEIDINNLSFFGDQKVDKDPAYLIWDILWIGEHTTEAISSVTILVVCHVADSGHDNNGGDGDHHDLHDGDDDGAPGQVGLSSLLFTILCTDSTNRPHTTPNFVAGEENATSFQTKLIGRGCRRILGL